MSKALEDKIREIRKVWTCALRRYRTATPPSRPWAIFGSVKLVQWYVDWCLAANRALCRFGMHFCNTKFRITATWYDAGAEDRAVIIEILNHHLATQVHHWETIAVALNASERERANTVLRKAALVHGLVTELGRDLDIVCARPYGSLNTVMDETEVNVLYMCEFLEVKHSYVRPCRDLAYQEIAMTELYDLITDCLSVFYN
jgi:hypothetical protein